MMAHLDQQANLVDVEHLRSECNWGFYHEVGHNHQVDDWTFDGTVEVTVNLFTLYVFEFLCGTPVTGDFHGHHESRAEMMALYDFDNPDFELWKREPFLALVMYAQIQQEFGWGRLPGGVRHVPYPAGPRAPEERRREARPVDGAILSAGGPQPRSVLRGMGRADVSSGTGLNR